MAMRDPDLDVLTDAQKRRAAALCLVALLYPGVTSDRAQKVAIWIVTGRTES